MKQIIGLCGFAQSGKDTAAKYLINNLGFHRVAFADPLRRGLYALNPIIHISPAMIHTLKISSLYNDKDSIKDGDYGLFVRLRVIVDLIDWDEAKKIDEVRQLLQRYGTEAGRNIHGEGCWIEAAARAMKGQARVVVTDCRFPNEAKAIREWGGKVVRIARKGVKSVNSHVSDKGLPEDMIDLTITNNGTIEELWSEMERLFN